jgi:hypothetical protein
MGPSPNLRSRSHGWGHPRTSGLGAMNGAVPEPSGRAHLQMGRKAARECALPLCRRPERSPKDEATELPSAGRPQKPVKHPKLCKSPQPAQTKAQSLAKITAY